MLCLKIKITENIQTTVISPKKRSCQIASVVFRCFSIVRFTFYMTTRIKCDKCCHISCFVRILLEFPADGAIGDPLACLRRRASLRHHTHSVFASSLSNRGETLSFTASVFPPGLDFCASPDARVFVLDLEERREARGRGTRRKRRVFGRVLLRMFMNRPNERGSIKH